MSNRNDEFFVGYFPMPARLSQFYKVLVALLLCIGAGFAFWVSSSQESAGKGQWNVAETTSASGFLTVNPYPVLHTSDGNPRSIMLLTQGKHSAAAFTEVLDGKHVQVTGFSIERGGWMSMELRSSDDIVATAAPAGQSAPVIEPLESVTLSGEVVDSKCFIGVMKPGGGKVHRACASLCVAGGIPPMLVVEQTDGSRFGYMLVDQQGNSAAEEVAETIAMPVAITGRLERRGDLTYLRLTDGGIQRL